MMMNRELEKRVMEAEQRAGIMEPKWQKQYFELLKSFFNPKSAEEHKKFDEFVVVIEDMLSHRG